VELLALTSIPNIRILIWVVEYASYPVAAAVNLTHVDE
jgi:hypothetical protein